MWWSAMSAAASAVERQRWICVSASGSTGSPNTGTSPITCIAASEHHPARVRNAPVAGGGIDAEQRGITRAAGIDAVQDVRGRIERQRTFEYESSRRVRGDWIGYNAELIPRGPQGVSWNTDAHPNP